MTWKNLWLANVQSYVNLWFIFELEPKLFQSFHHPEPATMAEGTACPWYPPRMSQKLHWMCGNALLLR